MFTGFLDLENMGAETVFFYAWVSNFKVIKILLFWGNGGSSFA